MSRYKKHKEAVKTIGKIICEPRKYLVIHYSCESFIDKEDGRTPRITSIAIRYFNSTQTRSFSIHKNAEQKRISVDEFEQRYNECEKEMLNEFFEFVKSHNEYYWLHWNMRDENFGFYAIERRYKVLEGTPETILNDRKIDVSRLFKDLYGDKYIGHPNIAKLIEKNELSHPDILSGSEEADAFEEKQYIKLHKSTLRKVDVFARFVSMASDNTLKTDATWKTMYGISFQGFFEMAKEKWWFAFLTLIIGTLLGVIINNAFS